MKYTEKKQRGKHLNASGETSKEKEWLQENRREIKRQVEAAREHKTGWIHSDFRSHLKSYPHLRCCDFCLTYMMSSLSFALDNYGCIFTVGSLEDCYEMGQSRYFRENLRPVLGNLWAQLLTNMNDPTYYSVILPGFQVQYCLYWFKTVLFKTVKLLLF